MPNKVRTTVESSLGTVSIDSDGSPIGVVRMAPDSLLQIPALLQRYINHADPAAWDTIKGKIDYIHGCLESALRPLAEATGFGEKVKAQVAEGAERNESKNGFPPESSPSRGGRIKHRHRGGL